MVLGLLHFIGGWFFSRFLLFAANTCFLIIIIIISLLLSRYNIPELAKKYKVYALDLLGFGWSEKALIEYDALVWRDQVVDFMKQIVKEPAVLVGNRQVLYITPSSHAKGIEVSFIPILANGMEMK